MFGRVEWESVKPPSEVGVGGVRKDHAVVTENKEAWAGAGGECPQRWDVPGGFRREPVDVDGCNGKGIGGAGLGGRDELRASYVPAVDEGVNVTINVCLMLRAGREVSEGGDKEARGKCREPPV